MRIRVESEELNGTERAELLSYIWFPKDRKNSCAQTEEERGNISSEEDNSSYQENFSQKFYQKLPFG